MLSRSIPHNLRTFFLVSSVVICAQLPLPAAEESPVEKAVVKVFATVRMPDPYKPWTKQSPVSISGSGVVIKGKRILSNAHVVLYSTQVLVEANQGGDKIPAKVVAVSPGIDLAVLELEDQAFFDTHPPLPHANKLPGIKDAVMAYGYPQGGTSLSITRGIVSRIEYALYNAPAQGLRIQIDAPMNPGNSGGPAVVDGKMIGLAFANLSKSQNIGYIIPNEEIDTFLDDVADGHYDGKPEFRDHCQTLENPALRAYLKLDKNVRGLIVHTPASTNADYPLKQWDVITKIGNTPLDDQGMVRTKEDLLVNFRYLVPKLVKDGVVPLTVLRDNQQINVQVPVHIHPPSLIVDLQGAYPSYFVCGPLVFSAASTSFIGGILRSSSSGLTMAALGILGSPLLKRLADEPELSGEQIVVVSSPLFPHKIATGYSSPALSVVKSVNGIHVKNLEHLVQIIRDSKDDYLTFDYDKRGGETMVFRRKELLGATEEILSDNGLRSQGSPDVMAVWDSKK